MGQLTAEERRRIFLTRQRTDRELHERLMGPTAAFAGRPARARLSRLAGIALVAALLGAGWLASHGLVLHVPASFADMLPRT